MWVQNIERSVLMNLVDKVNAKSVRTDIPEFRVGDTVRVDYKIQEGKNTRIQAFEGLVVSIKGGSISKTFTVRKKSGGVAVKRVFKVNSPLVDSVTVVRKGMVRRAKLNFIDGMEKEYKVKERN
jgi:large subunit ribosomal protein L19